MGQNLKDKEVNIRKTFELIEKSEKITLLTHFRPDGDGISACAAFSKILKKMNKKIESIFPSEPEFKFKRLPENILINKHRQTPELLIVLDTANYERFYYPKEFHTIPMINIDHHISNTIKGTYNFVEEHVSSTCEMIYTLFKKWNLGFIDKYVSECLLFGILSDSMIFHTQSTYPETLRISADLIELGANLYELKTELLSNKNPQIVALWGDIMSNIKISPKKNAIWAKVTQADLKKHDLTISSLIGFNNFLSQIAGIEITLLFYETENGKTKVSLRSKKEDINKFAAKFGGGGHKNAAGILSDKSIDELISEMTKEL